MNVIVLATGLSALRLKDEVDEVDEVDELDEVEEVEGRS